MQPLEEVHNALNLFWSPVSHLNSVMNSEELRKVYKQCLSKLSTYYTELGQNVDLYNTTLALHGGKQFDSLNQAQQQAVHNDIRDFELGGVSLNTADKIRYAQIAQDLSRLSTEFSDNVLDATTAWQKLVANELALAGLPISDITAARLRAKNKNLEGWLLTLDFPVYYSVMTFADDGELRKELYTAYNTRASDQGPHQGQFDNSELISEILLLRAEKASLLGYDNFAELSVVPKMAESPQQVLDFLNDLAARVMPAAAREYADLCEFASTQLGIDNLRAWDTAYVSDKLKQHQFSISDEDLKPYFPADVAIPGMFAVIGKLFGLGIKEIVDADVYHPDVRSYAITDQSGTLRGEFYLDTYAREHKRGGAWMDVCATRQRVGQGVQLPIAYLTCNLTPPVGDEPALLTHTEVTTLFHEFGHGLHHMLTTVDTSAVSGINGVEWDAVELPSQFLENWCWESESLDMLSSHYKTGEKLPGDLLKKLHDARNFQSAMQLVRQLEFSLFDMQIHLQSTSTDAVKVQSVINQVRDSVAVASYPEFNRFQHAFSHIFAGGYSAGYFSYKWAEVLSADAFSRFEEEGLFNSQTGQEFLQQVLEQGGSRKAMESFVAFRGREPLVDALLRHTGLAA